MRWGLTICVGVASSLSTEFSDEHFASLRTSWANAPDADRLALLNRTTSSVRALRVQVAARIRDVRTFHANATAAIREKRRHQFRLKEDPSNSAPPIRECGFSCGWSMYRDLTALARYVSGHSCELRDWVDWWSSGLGTLMIDEGEPLHRALLRTAQTYTGVGYGLPYAIDLTGKNENLVSMWEDIHGFVAAITLLQQTDRVVSRALVLMRKNFCLLGGGNAAIPCPTPPEFAGYALMVECIVTAFLMSGDVSMDPGRRNDEPGPLINGFYLAAMTASSVGYGDFAPYGSVAAYLSPVWMAILTGTFNWWAGGGEPVMSISSRDCDSMTGQPWGKSVAPAQHPLPDLAVHVAPAQHPLPDPSSVAVQDALVGDDEELDEALYKQSVINPKDFGWDCADFPGNIHCPDDAE